MTGPTPPSTTPAATLPEMQGASLGDRLFAAFQYLLPTRTASSLVHRITQIRTPWFKNTLIRAFLRGYTINLDEAEQRDATAYASFNAFFTRALRPGARPIEGGAETLVSPCDGTVSSCGRIDDDRVFQAKGHDYTLLELLGGRSDLAEHFRHGEWCTIYLAPYNYHRLHMPLDGRLRETIYVPGRLFSVNAATARAIPRLFARNERVIAMFDTAVGPMAAIFVGALFVGSVETVWAGQICPPHRRSGISSLLPSHAVTIERGAEIGRFNMGSTMILLTPPGALRFEEGITSRRTVRVGEALGQVTAPIAPV